MTSPTVQELFRLSDKVALITGGARNLGYDMALALAAA
jgi:NAD(P)-dependent dehydrogenase (short-subunit alcohol dehydrogenase family)